MNVLLAPAHYLLDGIAGGSEFGWAYHIVEELAGYDGMHLYVLTGGVKSDHPFPSNVTVISLDRRPVVHMTTAYRLLFIARYYLAALRILRRHRIDLVHHILPFGFTSTFNPLALLGHTRTIPFVVGPLQSPHTVYSVEEQLYAQGDMRVYHGAIDYVQEKVSGLFLRVGRPILEWLSRQTLRRSDCLIAVNTQTRDLYATKAPRVPGVVIPPGVDITRFDSPLVAREPRDTLEIVSVGWLIRRKGVELLIEAIARLVGDFPGVHLRLVGDGPQRETLQSLVATRGLAQNVFFEGIVANASIAGYYQRADIFVSMSYSESFGQSLVEAMLAGLPVVSADNVGSREIIEEGETGFLVPVGDVAALEGRLRLLLADASARATVGEKARATALVRYNWTTIGRQYLDVYKNVQRHSAGEEIFSPAAATR